MKEDLRTAVRDAVAPALEIGEQIEIEAFGGVGQVSVKRMVATTVVVSALTLGTVMAVAKPRSLFMVLTDRRLIFLEPSAMAGKPTSTIVFVLPREALSTVAAKRQRVLGIRPTLGLDLGIAGSEKGLRLQFDWDRTDGDRLAAALATS